MATLVQIRALYRRPLRLGTTRISDSGVGTAVDLDDPVVRRDLYRHLGNWTTVDDNFVTSVAQVIPHEAALTAGVTPPTALAAQTDAAVATANAATQSGSYVQADVQTIATLANALKTDYNKTVADMTAVYATLGTLVTDHNDVVADVTAMRTKLNDVIDSLVAHNFATLS